MISKRGNGVKRYVDEWKHREISVRYGKRADQVHTLHIARRNVIQNDIIISMEWEGVEVHAATQSAFLWRMAGGCPAGMEQKCHKIALRWFRRLLEEWESRKRWEDERERRWEESGEGWYVCETGSNLWERGYAIVYSRTREGLEEAFPRSAVMWARYKEYEDAVAATSDGTLEAVSTTAEVVRNREFGRAPFYKEPRVAEGMNMWMLKNLKLKMQGK